LPLIANDIIAQLIFFIFLAIKCAFCSCRKIASFAVPFWIWASTIIWANGDLIRRIVILRSIITSFRKYLSSVSTNRWAQLPYLIAFVAFLNFAHLWTPIAVFNVRVITFFVQIENRVRANCSWCDIKTVIPLIWHNWHARVSNLPVLSSIKS